MPPTSLSLGPAYRVGPHAVDLLSVVSRHSVDSKCEPNRGDVCRAVPTLRLASRHAPDVAASGS